ncbi:MAG: HIT domain-containing protein [Chloroflexi bacterium]|nr:HIT domain-containing protein [Chloroflexota bacterium]
MTGREPAEIIYEEEDILVFRNLLRWVPVMLLVIPKAHMSQAQLWSDPILAKIGRVAVDVGAVHCPEGFRLLSNFGWHAMQSQPHGHLHIVGGTRLGRYASG